MPSPVSPYTEQSKQLFNSQKIWSQATPQLEPSAMEQPPRGLGIFDCPMPQQQSTIRELPPSPHHSDSWSHPSMIEKNYPKITQPPNIFTEAFDPFSDYNNNADTGMISAPSDETPGLDFCQTPPGTNMPSHRSSVSSSSSPSLHHAEYYTPRVKTEDQNEWYPSPGNEQVLQRSLTTQNFTSYSNGLSPINGCTEDLYKSHTGEWSKSNSAPYPFQFSTMVGDDPRTRFDGAPVLPSVSRIKKKRQRTTPEEATHECTVCGKLFKRSYNWKSHLETHNPDRKYPHPCNAMIGNQPCTKKFQRKTDLDRHYDSVHLKARNHRCDLCGHGFPRRDTLRRHREDGCPKRFELGFRSETAAAAAATTPAPARWSMTTTPPRNRSYSYGGGLPLPHSSASMGPPAPTQATQLPFYPKADYVSSPLQTTSSLFAS
ncbi:MAG: hypothetical protein Q9217_003019 [Psora testacea]